MLYVERDRVEQFLGAKFSMLIPIPFDVGHHFETTRQSLLPQL